MLIGKSIRKLVDISGARLVLNSLAQIGFSSLSCVTDRRRGRASKHEIITVIRKPKIFPEWLWKFKANSGLAVIKILTLTQELIYHDYFVNTRQNIDIYKILQSLLFQTFLFAEIVSAWCSAKIEDIALFFNSLSVLSSKRK